MREPWGQSQADRGAMQRPWGRCVLVHWSHTQEGVKMLGAVRVEEM